MLLAAEIDDAFVALLEVAHMVGVVSYVDRQSAVLEAIVTARPGEATSLLIFLEPGDEEGVTEAFIGVEPLGGHPPADLDVLVDRIAELLARPRPPVPASPATTWALVTTSESPTANPEPYWMRSHAVALDLHD